MLPTVITRSILNLSGSLNDWLIARYETLIRAPLSRNLVPIREDSKTILCLKHEDILQNFKYSSDIVKAVKYCHNLGLYGVIHRDLKPQNILYDSRHDMFLISDFGLARDYSDKSSMTEEIGTWFYAAPEQFETSRYTKAVDLYPLGIILFQVNFPHAKSELVAMFESLKSNSVDTKLFRTNFREIANFCCDMSSKQVSKRTDISIINQFLQEQINHPSYCKQGTSWYHQERTVLQAVSIY